MYKNEANNMINEAKKNNNGKIYIYDNNGPFSTGEDRFTIGVNKSTTPFTAEVTNPNNSNVVNFQLADCDTSGYCKLNGDGVGCLSYK